MLGYKAALQWLIDNDDTFWLDDTDNIMVSVSTALVIDIYGKDEQKVINDLRKLRSKKEKQK